MLTEQQMQLLMLVFVLLEWDTIYRGTKSNRSSIFHVYRLDLKI